TMNSDAVNKDLYILLAIFSTYPEIMKKLKKEREETVLVFYGFHKSTLLRGGVLFPSIRTTNLIKLAFGTVRIHECEARIAIVQENNHFKSILLLQFA
ncbi:MAG: hypothetical protein ACTS8R_05770, partial [Arsenophonus sp. NC-QC1-MAG3]